MVATACAATARAQNPSPILSSQFNLMASKPQMTIANPPTNGNLSGVTYSPVSNSLFVIDNGSSQLYEFDLNGVYRRTILTTGFDDPEGLTWLDGNRFALLEEKTTHINIIDIAPTTTTINRASLPLASIIRPDLAPNDPSAGSLNPTGGNTGLEGVAFDSINNRFIVLKEKSAGTPGDYGVNVFSVGWDGAASVLFNPSVPHGAATQSLLSLATDVADAHFDPVTQHLLVLSQESKRIIEVTLGGEVVGYRSQPGTQVEGVTMLPDGKTLFVVGESREFFRYESSPLLKPLIAPGAIWKYKDDGADPGIAWRRESFVDAAWLSGAAELGYGDLDEATTIRCGPTPTCTSSNIPTTYFRKTFSVDNAAQVVELSLGIQRDDAAIVYLNGVEVYRDAGLPANPASTRFSTTSVADPVEDFFVHLDIDPALLHEGDNLLAVEVHQFAATDLDLSFNAQLIARYSAVPEPGALALAVGGIAVVGLRMWRRRR
jgi:uncharacterized protein YjiK